MMRTIEAEAIQFPEFNSPAAVEVDALLDRFAHFGVELGLERIQNLLKNLGNPHQRVSIIHVAGSNGKGSVCAYLSAILTQAGYRVGRYTSPHLVHWCERICLNEQAIAPSALHQLLLQVLDAIDPDLPSPTQFEVFTAAAWLYFAQQQVDLAVMEVGLGGRLDATNVCDRPLASIITSLSREHWQRLGPTLADISREKAGILKLGCPAVVAPLPAEAEVIIRQRTLELSCPTLWIEPSLDLGQGWAQYCSIPHVLLPASDCLKYFLPLPGAHQLANSALAIATVQLLQQQGWKIDKSAIVEGMARTHWLARLQWTAWQNHPLLIDGAHNPAAAQTLRHYVDHNDRIIKPISWVMGMIANKDHADVFQALLRPGDRLYMVPVPDHLSAEPEALVKLADEICPELLESHACPDVLIGLERAIAAGKKEEPVSTIILSGSLYLIGHFFRLIG